MDEPKITANRLVGRLPAQSGPCPECGCPAVWTDPGGGLVAQHHDPIEHEACPIIIRQQRMNRILVEGVKRFDYLDLLDSTRPLDGYVQKLAERQRDAIDAELFAIPPGYRLCMHDAMEMMSNQDDEALHPDQDIYTIRVRQRGHVLEPGEVCRHHGTRAEYGWPAGALIRRLGPCGRLDDCRVIEAADGTRYWFRSHGCPVRELPAAPWTDLDELAADAWRREWAPREPYDLEQFAERLARVIDATYSHLLVSVPIETGEPVTMEKIKELYDRIMKDREYRPDPGKYLGNLDG